jgi:hypothetical protein
MRRDDWRVADGKKDVMNGCFQVHVSAVGFWRIFAAVNQQRGRIRRVVSRDGLAAYLITNVKFLARYRSTREVVRCGKSMDMRSQCSLWILSVA